METYEPHRAVACTFTMMSPLLCTISMGSSQQCICTGQRIGWTGVGECEAQNRYSRFGTGRSWTTETLRVPLKTTAFMVLGICSAIVSRLGGVSCFSVAILCHKDTIAIER